MTRDQSKRESTTVSRRQCLIRAGAASVVSLTAGCLGGAETGEQSPAETKTQGPATAESISVVARGRSGTLFRRLVRDYVEQDTDLSIDTTLLTYEELFSTIKELLSTGGTEYDLLYMDDPWFPQFAPDLAPIKKWVPGQLPEEEIIDSCLEIATWPTPGAPPIPGQEGIEKRQRAQVVVGNTQLFAYNQSQYELVDRQKPETWQDVLEIGTQIDQQLQRADGYAIRGKRGNPIMANFYSIGSSIAGDMFEKNWQYGWNDQQGIDAVRLFTRKLRDISPSGVASFTSGEVLSRLGRGEVAQALVWPAAALQLLNPEKTPASADISFARIPRGKRYAPQQGNWMVGINSNVEDAKKRAAGRVIQSFISARGQQRYVELGGIPFRHDTFKNNLDAEPFFEPLYESLKTAQWRPRTPLWSRIETIQGNQLHGSLTGEISPELATQQSQEEIEVVLDQAGYYS